MAYNHEYRHRFTSGGWRYLLRMRMGSASLVTSYTPIDLDPYVVIVTKYGREFEKVPLGMPTAMNMSIELDTENCIGNADLEYLSERLVASCYYSGGTLRYNAFLLSSDRGDSELPEDEFLWEAVTLQRPTIEQEQDLFEVYGTISIETFDALKVASESAPVEDWFSFDGAGDPDPILTDKVIGTPVSVEGTVQSIKTTSMLDRIYVSASDNKRAVRLILRRLTDYMATMQRLVCGDAYFHVRKRDIHGPSHETLIGTLQYNPWAWWTFFKQEGADQNDTGDALAPSDIMVCSKIVDVNGTFSGYESKTSRMSPQNKYPSWWDYLKDVAEHAVVKALVRWQGSACYPTIDYVPVFASDVATIDIDATVLTAATHTRGTSVIRSCKVTLNARSKEVEGMPADLTEVEVESANTLAQDDYQIKALLHNNQPSTSAYRVKPNYAGAQLVSDEMWLDWLLYLDGDGKAVVVHHYIEGTDGLDAITGETPVIDAAYAISLDDADNLNMVRPVNWSKVIAKQQALTGLPNTVAALVHRSFSRIDQALLDGEADFHADLTPMNVGRMINLHVSGDWVARTGLASPWYCCLLGSEMNVIAEKMTLKLFIVGS